MDVNKDLEYFLFQEYIKDNTLTRVVLFEKDLGIRYVKTSTGEIVLINILNNKCVPA